jgi:flavin reductase
MSAMKDDFLTAMSRAANSVCVVTTDGIGGRAGVTVSAMTSVSVDTPAPSLLVCIHGLSPACDAIRTNRVFCANLLSESQAAISDSFAGRTGAKGVEKFACAEWDTGATGCPVLQGALAAFDCRLVHDILVGSHRIFVGELEGLTLSEERAPLIHHDRGYARAVPQE